MATESPHHPQPDEIPENERTGGEPNSSGKRGRPEDDKSRRSERAGVKA